MARQTTASTENNFTKGLLTEFTGLNFPENACTDTDNCIFERTGRVKRRLGFDYEVSASFTTSPLANKAQSHYMWKNTGDGTLTIYVQQLGNFLFFYDASTVADAYPLSGSLLGNVNMNAFIPSGVVGGNTGNVECDYASGYGYLFVFNPHAEPFYVDEDLVATAISVRIRDFKGLDDGLGPTESEATLSPGHFYNLNNQGWGGSYEPTSATSVTIGLGDQALTLAGANANAGTSGFNVGDTVAVYQPGTLTLGTKNEFNSTEGMLGVVKAYVGPNIVVSVYKVTGGLGNTHSDWFVRKYPDKIFLWQDKFRAYPSNSTVWWRFKNPDEEFDPTVTYKDVPINAAAPKGHYTLAAFAEHRDVESELLLGLGGAGDANAGADRPAAGAFFAGRVFYAGPNSPGYGNQLYYSQIVENRDPTFFGKCHQVNDPTSEELFDLLPTDGGVVVIQGCGVIQKLFVMQEVLLIFATNGIWGLSGSVGTGFTATDFTLHKLDNIPTLTHSSFVDVKGNPVWWNTAGIYTAMKGENGFQVQSLTETTIATFYDSIPAECKKFVTGAYNKDTFIIQWIYRSTKPTTLRESYFADRVLSFNTVTGAFYPWTITTSLAPLNDSTFLTGITVVENEGGHTDFNTLAPRFKYQVCLVTGGTDNTTFAEEIDTEYHEWASRQVGIDYTSFFVTGYRVHGDANRKFQITYVNVYNEIPEENELDVAYKFQGVWDWSLSSDSGRRTTTSEYINLSNAINPVITANYKVLRRRHKIRGHGYAVQFNVSSRAGLPFYIIGWSSWETKNASL